MGCGLVGLHMKGTLQRGIRYPWEGQSLPGQQGLRRQSTENTEYKKKNS